MRISAAAEPWLRAFLEGVLDRLLDLDLSRSAVNKRLGDLDVAVKNPPLSLPVFAYSASGDFTVPADQLNAIHLVAMTGTHTMTVTQSPNAYADVINTGAGVLKIDGGAGLIKTLNSMQRAVVVSDSAATWGAPTIV